VTTGQFNSSRRRAGFFEGDRVRDILAAASCGLLWFIYLAIYLPFLPTADETIGHDYSLHFPNLLTGYFWFLHNGLSAIPWFSPSQCGGFAYFADPNVGYFSVPQFLVFLVSPMRAIQLTLLLFSLIGMAGSYALMRHAFRSSRAASVLAAGIFLFNGFFAYRMLIGHLTFHAFTLIPVMAVAVLPADMDRRPPLPELVGRACVAAACLAYMFQSGMVHGIPPALLAMVVILMIHGLCFGWRWRSWLLLAVAGALSLAMCAGKLVAELALLSSFPRDSYPLPGVAGLFSTFWVAAQTLFFSPPVYAADVLTNTMWALERHEWEYGVSAAPLILVAAAAVVAGANVARRRKLPPFRLDRVLAVVTIAILLSIPIALNWYQPDWNRLLKAAPYFGNSNTLLRFFSAYIPVVVILAGLALDRLPLPAFAQGHGRLLLAVIGLGIVVSQNIATDRAYYAGQGYEIAPIEAAYARAQLTRSVPAIEAIGGSGDDVGGNDAMIEGRSQLDCYQPLFGYRLESFPAAPLQQGSVFTEIGQVINVKNPACYVFPAENGCRPGDHFTIAQVEEAKAFLSYRPIAFEQPYRQQLATWVSLISMVFTAAALLAAALGSLFARRAKTGEMRRR
jgi:hypothetical protein